MSHATDRRRAPLTSRIDGRGWFVHLARWGLLVVIVLAIRDRHAQLVADERARRELTATLEQVQELLPSAVAFGTSNETGGVTIINKQGEPVGFALQTAPSADDIVGYSGPNNVLLVFDKNDQLAGATLLSSGDTPSHVEVVRADDAFFRSLTGLTWDQIKSSSGFDTVSGATLTSAAIAEGIVQRLGGTRPSLRFPEPITLGDVEPFFPEAKAIEYDVDSGSWRVRNGDGMLLGRLLRTSPHSDNHIGYGGPTDGLLALDGDGDHIVGIGFKRTFDTPRYVEDVTLDWTFMHRFDGMPLDVFASLTVGAGADVEGVSGATMTSQVLVENLVAAARRFREQTRSGVSGDSSRPKSSASLSDVRVATRDVGTAIVVLLSLVIAFTNLRGRNWLRRVWQVLLISYLGLINVDLLSQALFVGWVQNEIPWRIAPSLVLLCVAALVVPLATKTQIYCHHLCPHGAAQELLRNRLPWRLHLPSWMDRALSFVPSALLVLVFVVAIWQLPLDLTGIEPFDAYALQAAGAATVVVAIAGLLASLFVPMAYCRYGCPTGALLGYLRRNRQSGRLRLQDALAAGLALVAALAAWGA